MKEKLKKKIQWLKENKIGVLLTTGLLIATGIYVESIRRTTYTPPKIEDLGIDLRYRLDLEEVAIKDLGNVGKNFLEHIPEANDDTLVEVVAYIEKSNL